MIAGNNSKSIIQSAAKIFAILETMAQHEAKMKLSALSETLNLPTSTVYRILNTLLQLGYVQQDPATGEYGLGVKILTLAGAVLTQLDVRSIARPVLEKVRDETGETANLVVLDSDEVLYVEKAEGRASVRAFSLIGKRAPLHATGVGKIFLADMSWPDVLEILSSKGMPKLTPNTITDLNRLVVELNQIRVQGFALDREECEVGVMCVATPIRDHTGRVVACLSISGPKGRLTREAVQTNIAILKRYSSLVSMKLGYMGKEHQLQILP